MNESVKSFVKNTSTQNWTKWLARIILIVFVLIIVLYVGLAWYINTHKKEVQAALLEELNGGLSGTLTVGSMDPTFLKGFPDVSLKLEDVILRDSLYNNHKHTLLQAREFNVAVSLVSFLRGAINIKKMSIGNAAIDMYTDANGYSNTAVFKKNKKAKKGEGGGSFPELRKLSLENVTLAIDNRKMHKLYKFTVYDLDAKIKYRLSGWEAGANLDALAHSMAFNTQRGSFIKEKTLDGRFDISYDEDKGFIVVEPNKLEIGGEDFVIGAKFEVADNSSGFEINISNENILWLNAARLLSPNITTKLEMFKLSKPIKVKCNLVGDFNAEGDPLIYVEAQIRDNELDTPGGRVSNCSFNGVFTNNHIKSKGFNDANSAIKLYNFNGLYNNLPVVMKKAFILDLEKPVAVGDFSSHFDMPKLSSVIDSDLLSFKSGTADIKVDFKADIVDFKISKPYIKGVINVKDSDFTYVPRKMNFNDVSVALNFTTDDLTISKIAIKTKNSIINMEGHIKNFMNLYYTDPEKIVLNWNVTSPQLNAGEFIAFLGSRKNARAAIQKSKKGNFTKEMNEFFEKTNVDFNLAVEKLYYKKFLAADVKANVLMTEKGFVVKDAGLKHAGGSLVVNGGMSQSGKLNKFDIDVAVKNVDVRKFFYAFDNFGLESLKSENLRGIAYCKAKLQGKATDAGVLVPRSMYGQVSFNLKNGKLLNFDPVRNVGKFAFPFRDMNTIEFYNLDGKFDVAGEKVTIHPMQINSSVLNMDVQGVYSFGKGTQIYIDVPLRNPKKDKDITDEEELAKRRNRGIVVHLTAEDDKDGKVKVKLGGKKT